MTDKLATLVPRITQLLLIALGSGSSDGERINAIRAIQRQLKGANSDSHDLLKRLEATPLSEDEMQRIFNAGIERGRAEEVENARRNAVTIATPFAIGDVGPGVGPYSWLQIAQHCERNTHRLDDWERGFIASVVRRLRYKPPSQKEAAKLHDIFHTRFGERIQE
jgi:hypothetical protein